MRSHDCLYSRRHHLEHAGLWLFTHPACDITFALFPQCSSISSLSLSSQISCGSVTPWPTCSHKPIPPKRLKDKLNLMPCNKLSRLLCTVRNGVSQWRYWACVHVLICTEITSQHAARSKALLERSELDNKCKIVVLVKHLQLQLMNSVNCVADRVCVRPHLRGNYEIQRVVELLQLEKQTGLSEKKTYQPLLK